MKRLRDRQLRRSRVALVLTGLVLVALGGMALLLDAEVVERLGDPVVADGPVLNGDGRELLDRDQTAFQVGAVVGGLVLVAFGTWWLRQQMPPVRHQVDTELGNAVESVPGRNLVVGDALAHALERDLESAPAVDRARAEFRTDDDLLRLRLDVDETWPVDDLLVEIVDPAVERIATVGELDPRPDLEVDIRPFVVGAARAA